MDLLLWAACRATREVGAHCVAQAEPRDTAGLTGRLPPSVSRRSEPRALPGFPGRTTVVFALCCHHLRVQ